MSNNTEFVYSRTIPIEPGQKPASQSLPVTLPIDQGALKVVDATALVSDVKASMFGIPVVEQRQFLLQELPNYGIDSNNWYDTGSVSYIPLRGAVNLAVPSGGGIFSAHTTRFAYKYQPGKPTFVSQAIQCAKGAAIANSLLQWGEYTKSDGYGWRLMSKIGTQYSNSTITPWHNYLFFFRRTSAIPSSVISTTTVCPGGLGTGTAEGRRVGDSILYRPSYLVTNYIGTDTWEDIAFTTLDPAAPTTSRFNQDRFTGKADEGAPDISGSRTGKFSAKLSSFIADSYQVSGCTATSNSTTVNCNTQITVAGQPPLQLLQPGMTVRGTGIPSGTTIASVGNNSIVLSNATSGAISGGILYFNEQTNLCMFLIERSWYGGSGGRGLAYIPDQNPPFNGSTRWVTGHEIRIGDTLPVPSMSSPDMPITYIAGQRTGSSTQDVNCFLRRFGVSVWINGGDPRPAKIESASSTGLTITNDKYKIMLAIAVKPFVYNENIESSLQERPQKSRVYPMTLNFSSTANTEIYLIKNSSREGGNIVPDTSAQSNWYALKTSSEHLRSVAVLRGSVLTSPNDVYDQSNGYPVNTGGKLIGAFYCGANESAEINLEEIFDPQRELLGRAETIAAGAIGDTLTIIARSLSGGNAIASTSLIYGVQ